MNAKTCKKIRRIAREMTVGKPNVSYVGRTIQKLLQTKDGDIVPVNRVVIRVTKDCTRGKVREMKRIYRIARRAA